MKIIIDFRTGHNMCHDCTIFCDTIRKISHGLSDYYETLGTSIHPKHLVTETKINISKEKSDNMIKVSK